LHEQREKEVICIRLDFFIVDRGAGGWLEIFSIRQSGENGYGFAENG
jgi:hypothetical protein